MDQELYIDQIPLLKWNEVVRLTNVLSSTNTNLTAVGQNISSSNYISGVAGWVIKSNGDVEFNNGTFRGAISGSTIDIGGNDSTSFHVDAAGRMWSGSGVYTTALFRVGSISGGDGTVWLNGAAATERILNGTTAFVSRSKITLADTTAEGGSDAGSNFSISVFSDAGSLLATPFLIQRKTGNICISAFGGTLPNAASILEIQSTTKGVRFPNMTTTQRDAISSPPAGLVIYNTSTGKLNVFTSGWEGVTSA